ncbi:MAG: hypothetical protein M3348_06225 [Acidobacteriota bacterium]|nr:hypothetical protein [Acidobacteriota bacterium]
MSCAVPAVVCGTAFGAVLFVGAARGFNCGLPVGGDVPLAACGAAAFACATDEAGCRAGTPLGSNLCSTPLTCGGLLFDEFMTPFCDEFGGAAGEGRAAARKLETGAARR